MSAKNYVWYDDMIYLEILNNYGLVIFLLFIELHQKANEVDKWLSAHGSW